MSDLTDTVNAMTTAVNTLSTKVDGLAKTMRRRRTQLIVLACSVALDLLLSGAMFYLLNRTNNEAHDRAVAECVASNKSSTKEHVLWAGLLSLPATGDQPPIDPAVLASFNKLLDDTFPQQVC